MLIFECWGCFEPERHTGMFFFGNEPFFVILHVMTEVWSVDSFHLGCFG